jgi:hypothetical protein
MGNVEEAFAIIKECTERLIKLKINLLDYSVLSNKYPCILEKKKQYSVKTVAFLLNSF